MKLQINDYNSPERQRKEMVIKLKDGCVAMFIGSVVELLLIRRTRMLLLLNTGNIGVADQVSVIRGVPERDYQLFKTW